MDNIWIIYLTTYRLLLKSRFGLPVAKFQFFSAKAIWGFTAEHLGTIWTWPPISFHFFTKTHIHMYIYPHARMYVCIYIYIYMYMYIHIHMHLHKYLHIHRYMYTYTYTYIHTHTSRHEYIHSIFKIPNISIKPDVDV